MKVLIIIPAYNESESIVNTVQDIKTYAPDVDYIVINDGSTDSTESVLVENNLNHIRLLDNLGIGGAVQTGYIYAHYENYDYAIQMDGDGQHKAEFIHQMIQEAEQGGHNLVIGSRFIENKGDQSTFLRRMGIRLIAGTISLLSGQRVTDTTSGFRLADKKTIEFFSRDYPDDYPESETLMTLLRKKYSVKETPIMMRDRQGGKSSISPLKSVYFVIKVMMSIFFSFITHNGKEDKSI